MRVEPGATTILDGARLLARHGGVVEVRILKTTKATVSGYFDNVEALASAVTGWDGKANIYVTANPVNPALLARAQNRLREFARETTADREILRRAWFLLDTDPVRPAGISATDAEVAAALERRNETVGFVRELGFSEPVIAMSGNGGHALWTLDLPNDDAVTRLFERALKALTEKFSDNVVTVDEAVFNPARIWKLYGTIAAKGDVLPDRPHRRAVLEHVPPELVTLDREILEQLSAMGPTERTYSMPGPRLEPLDLVGALEARGFYRRALGRGKHAVTCPWASEHSGDSGVTETCVFDPKAPGEPWGFDCKHAHCSARTIKDLIAFLGLSGGARHDGAAPPPMVGERDGLGLVSVGDLLGEPDGGPAWLVANRLPAGGLGMVAGKPKAGKSTLARVLALHVARGEPWLGFATTAGPVIYLALEEKRQEVRNHFRALGATGADPIYVLCSAAPADALARVRREAERRRPVLIIIDPLFRLVRVPTDGGNDYATMTAALEPLLMLARETGAHVLVVHHLGKGQREDGDAILGSTAIFAAVDTALLLKRSEKYRTLSSIQRYGDDLEEITLTLDPITRDVLAGPPRAEAEAAEAASLILQALETAADPVTEAELDGAIECRRQVWKKALRDLVGTGKVVRSGRGGKGDPFRYCGSLVYVGTREPKDPFPAQPPVLQSKDSGSRVPYRVLVPEVPPNQGGNTP